jgi:hypothetical protein
MVRRCWTAGMARPSRVRLSRSVRDIDRKYDKGRNRCQAESPIPLEGNETLSLLAPALGGPWPAPGEQLWEVRLEHAELVAPRVAHDPEVKAALLLVVIAGRAERFQGSDLGLHVVGLQVEVHPFLETFSSSVRWSSTRISASGESEPPVDVAALLGQWLLDGVEGGGPERDRSVEVVAVDHEVADATAVMVMSGGR